ncbi:MAG: ABC transporter substrate-binding protein [archaeon]|nr:ABC transporter substrate-binding protein [archaeon]
MTQADVDLLEKILNATDSTAQFEVKYLGCYKNVYTSLFPLKGKMCVDYSTAYDMAVIIGCLDQICGTRESQSKIDSYSEQLYPGLKTHLKPLVNDGGKFDAEKLAAEGIKIVLGDCYDVPQTLEDQMKKLDPSCTVLHLTVNRVVDGMNYTNTIVTLASLMNKQAAVADYITYVENVEASIKDAISNSYAANKTMLIVYNPSSANAIGIDCLNTMKMQYTDISNALLLPFTCALPAVERYMGGMYNNLEAEYVATVNPEVIILETYNIAGSAASDDDKKAVVREKLSFINVTNAYKNNKVICMPFEVIGGAAGIATLQLIGNLAWGETYFPEADAWDAINYYYQHFTNMGDSVDMRDVYGYAPVAYGKDQLP